MAGEDCSEAPSVLLVDDDAGSLAAMLECLVREGFRVATASTGSAALEAVQRTSFDVFVIDVFLPDAGGLGLLRTLSRGDQTSTPVLFITGLSNPAVSKALAPAPVLFKPFRRRQLVASVRAMLRPQAASGELT